MEAPKAASTHRNPRLLMVGMIIESCEGSSDMYTLGLA